MKGTYRVEQDHPLVHDLEVFGHRFVVVLELIHQVGYFDVFYFDDERVREFGVLR